jgi:hypothetical protein
MRRKTRNQYLTLTEACPCASLLHNITLYFRFAELKATTSPFLFLAVDLPPPPLFQDAVEKNIIPQVGIHSVLAKYDGIQTQVGSIHRHDFFLTSYSHLLFIAHLGIKRSTTSVQLRTTPAISHYSLQKVHKKQFRRGEKSNYRKLPLERR